MTRRRSRQVRAAIATLLTGLTVTALSGCTGSPEYSDSVTDAPSLYTMGLPHISVTGWRDQPLRDHAVGVQPGAPITVTAAEGSLSSVVVSGPDGPVKGTTSSDGSRWVSADTLDFGTSYTVTAAARGVEGEGAARVGFSTASASSLASASTVTEDNETVGVGQPVAISFDQPVTDRRNAQNAIKVTTDPPVAGAFYWISDTMVRWRPQHYWKPGTKVHVAVRTKGIDLGDGVFGDNNLDSDFTVGRRFVAIADDTSKTIQVYENGKLVKTMPTSMGKDSSPTNNGIYIVAERVPSVIMDSSTYGVPVSSSEGYREVVYSATRISFSGIYVHSAPWSVGDQGNTDVSNGCLNVSPENAKWFLDNSLRGDIVVAKNTNGPPLPGDDGLGDWNVPWSVWSKGNA